MINLVGFYTVIISRFFYICKNGVIVVFRSCTPLKKSEVNSNLLFF